MSKTKKGYQALDNFWKGFIKKAERDQEDPVKQLFKAPPFRPKERESTISPRDIIRDWSPNPWANDRDHVLPGGKGYYVE